MHCSNDTIVGQNNLLHQSNKIYPKHRHLRHTNQTMAAIELASIILKIFFFLLFEYDDDPYDPYPSELPLLLPYPPYNDDDPPVPP
mmetsp:Transcript_31554/g.76324  ORF Transcript_31554/g.76324 Transcript_31554/m.76324 type:complete len:86 (-) Transcript_31554:382-639(-)